MKLRILAISLILMLWAPAADANMRAPKHVPNGPSTAIGEPVDGLTVTSEELAFDCGPGLCHVEATYHVEADSAAEVTTDFILPTDDPVAYAFNGASAHVTPVPLDGEDVPARIVQMSRPFYGPVQMFQATLSGKLESGANEITVRYDQPLAQHEAVYGYFTKSRWVQTLVYEMWPLRSWNLDDDFAMSVSVTFESPRKAWYKRLFSKERAMACLGASGDSVMAEREDAQLVFSTEFTDAFPDRFMCTYGDEDLVPIE